MEEMELMPRNVASEEFRLMSFRPQRREALAPIGRGFSTDTVGTLPEPFGCIPADSPGLLDLSVILRKESSKSRTLYPGRSLSE
jgi:hypothetical protein